MCYTCMLHVTTITCYHNYSDTSPCNGNKQISPKAQTGKSMHKEDHLLQQQKLVT